MEYILKCGIDLAKISDEELKPSYGEDLSPTSVLIYPFDKDLKKSDRFVRALIKLIEENTDFKCKKSQVNKEPDISVVNRNGELVCRLEAKYLSGKPFMKVKQMIDDILEPYETLVIDEPKLLSYFSCMEKESRKIPIFVVWKFDRPHKVVGGITVYQKLEKLREIYLKKGLKRRFRRRVGAGDHKGGIRLGIIDKYHFSIRECHPIESLIIELNNLE